MMKFKYMKGVAMDKNTLINKKTTEAYNLYAREIFRTQIELRIHDEPFDFEQGYLSELNLRKAITKHLGSWLTYNMIWWKDLKDCHLKQEKVGEHSFETYAKLHYCGSILANIHCAASVDVDVANMLMSLHYRMLIDKIKAYGQQITAHAGFEKLQNRPIYKYLSHLSKEISGLKTSYDEIFKVPIEQLADELFNRIATLQYKLDKTVISPIVDPYYNGVVNRDWKYKRFKTNNITCSEALELAKAKFNDWLDVDLREWEVGRDLL